MGFMPNTATGGGSSSAYGTATTLTLTNATTSNVALPSSIDGIWDCYLYFTQNTSNGALDIYFNNDTTNGHYKWLQMSNNDSSNAFYGPGATSDAHIPLSFNDGTVTIKAATEFYAHFKIIVSTTATNVNGLENYTRSTGDGWAGTFHGTFNAIATSIYITTSAGTMTGSLVIIPG